MAQEYKQTYNKYSNSRKPTKFTLGDENDEDSPEDFSSLQSYPNNDNVVTGLRQNLRSRGTSITFDDTVKLDDGAQHHLGSPLPKPSDTRSPPVQIPSKHRPRRYSDAELPEFDPITGASLHASSRDKPFHEGESRWPLQQQTVDQLAAETAKLAITSKVPPLNTDLESLHLSTSSPYSGPLSPASTSIPQSGITLQRESSLRQSTSLSRRTVSQRSFGSVGSVGRRKTLVKSPTSSLSSPARSFLSSFSAAATPVRAPEEDDEGQEIRSPAGPIYIIGKQIGYGGFSIVKEAYTLVRNEKRLVRAVKIVRKHVANQNESDNERIQSDFEREIDLWRYLHHRHILPLITAYSTDFATYCVMPNHRGGTLFDLVRLSRRPDAPASENGLEPQVVRRYMAQLASAVRYLHEDAHVVHRDIKPENILLDITGGPDESRILLCDFGMAAWLQSPDDVPTPTRETDGPHHGPGAVSTGTIQGSLEYTAPELLLPQGPGTHVPVTAVDVWAFGCVAYTLLTCSRPFSHEYQPMLVAKISKGNWDREALNVCLGTQGEHGHGAVDCVTRCLEMNPFRRVGIRGILDSEWLRDVVPEDDEDHIDGMPEEIAWYHEQQRRQGDGDGDDGGFDDDVSRMARYQGYM